MCKLKGHVSSRGIIASVSMMVHRLEALYLNRKSGVSRTAGEEVLVLAVTMETVIVVMVIVVTLVVPTADGVMSEVRTLGDRLKPGFGTFVVGTLTVIQILLFYVHHVF